MRSIKFFVGALVLGLTGAVYAAGSTQDATHTHATATENPGCCKMHMAGDKKSGASPQETCDMKDSGCCKADCCKAHAQKLQANAHAKSQAHNATAEGCACCSGGSCQMHKEQATAAQVAADSKGSANAGCCASADCCQDSACCKAHHAAAPEATADKGDHHGCCTSCRMAHGAGY
jgi:hypothetical protein